MPPPQTLSLLDILPDVPLSNPFPFSHLHASSEEPQEILFWGVCFLFSLPKKAIKILALDIYLQM